MDTGQGDRYLKPSAPPIERVYRRQKWHPSWVGCTEDIGTPSSNGAWPDSDPDDIGPEFFIVGSDERGDPIGITESSPKPQGNQVSPPDDDSDDPDEPDNDPSSYRERTPPPRPPSPRQFPPLLPGPPPPPKTQGRSAPRIDRQRYQRLRQPSPSPPPPRIYRSRSRTRSMEPSSQSSVSRGKQRARTPPRWEPRPTRGYDSYRPPSPSRFTRSTSRDRESYAWNRSQSRDRSPRWDIRPLFSDVVRSGNSEEQRGRTNYSRRSRSPRPIPRARTISRDSVNSATPLSTRTSVSHVVQPVNPTPSVQPTSLSAQPVVSSQTPLTASAAVIARRPMNEVLQEITALARQPLSTFASAGLFDFVSGLNGAPAESDWAILWNGYTQGGPAIVIYDTHERFQIKGTFWGGAHQNIT